MFFRGSRYETVAEAEIDGADGREIRYKRMRFVPRTAGQLTETIREGDRPDLVAYRTFGDPEQFWRLADVNRVLKPSELTREPGRRIGVPGPGLV